jgi:acyl carrier protein
MSILEEAKEVVAEQLSVDINTITPDSKFIDDLGADSLDIVELVMALEEKFDIEIPDSDAEGIITLQNAVDYVEKNK